MVPSSEHSYSTKNLEDASTMRFEIVEAYTLVELLGSRLSVGRLRDQAPVHQPFNTTEQSQYDGVQQPKQHPGVLLI